MIDFELYNSFYIEQSHKSSQESFFSPDAVLLRLRGIEADLAGLLEQHAHIFVNNSPEESQQMKRVRGKR